MKAKTLIVVTPLLNVLNVGAVIQRNGAGKTQSILHITSPD